MFQQLRKHLARLRLQFEELDLVPLGNATQNISIELSPMPGKTAVTQIQEIAVRRRGNLQYELIEAIVLPYHKHTIRLTYTEDAGKRNCIIP